MNIKYFITRAFLVIVSINFTSEVYGQLCTKLAIRHVSALKAAEENDEVFALVDSLTIQYFKEQPELFEATDTACYIFMNSVYKQLSLSFQKNVSLTSILRNLEEIRDYYIIEANGYSKAYNSLAEMYSIMYNLSGLSPKGMEVFVIHYKEYMEDLFFKEIDGFNPVSPVALKPIALQRFEKHMSKNDLDILAKGWDIKIEYFIKEEQKRDSIYYSSLSKIIPLIDSLKSIYFPRLLTCGGTIYQLLDPEDQIYWDKISAQYTTDIDSIKSRLYPEFKGYNLDFAPHIWGYNEFCYELKKIFPSYNFWTWRNGPKLNNPFAEEVDQHECLTLYIEFEEKLVQILEAYPVRIGFPNYYFHGSRHWSDEKKKDIQEINAIIFSCVHHKD